MVCVWDFFTPEEKERVGRAVDSAPSLFNERPWFLRIVADDRVELHLDPLDRDESRLPREVAISCGAALYNLRLAIRAAGHAVNEVLVADLDRDDTLLATVEIVTGRVAPATDAEQELYEAIPYRRTNREPYTLLRAPEPLLVEMEAAAAVEEGWLRIVRGRGRRKRLLREEERAERRLGRGRDSSEPGLPGVVSVTPIGLTKPGDELSGGTGGATEWPGAMSSRINKVPRDNYGPAPVGKYPVTRRDFWLPDREALFEKPRRAQLMILSTDDDKPLDWIRAGRALQHALLTATRFSMSAPYGRSARYSAPRRYGLPARRAPVLASHQVPARYGVTVSPLTALLEVRDLDGDVRRWPWRSYYPEIPQFAFRVGYAPVYQAPPQAPRPLRWEDARPKRTDV